jgi:hypothetical protein
MSYSKSAIWFDFNEPIPATINIPISDADTPVEVIVNNNSLLAAVTFVFPVTNVQDGQTVKISAKSTITLVSMNVETGGAIWGALTSLLGGGSGTFKFRASNKTWYKF